VTGTGFFARASVLYPLGRGWRKKRMPVTAFCSGSASIVEFNAASFQPGPELLQGA
jgi:hypothetical protein